MNKRMYTAIVIVLAALAAAAQPAMARGIHAGGTAEAKGVELQGQCDEKLRGNSDWASVVLNDGFGWPYYTFASRDYPYYDHGYCNYGDADQSYGYAPSSGKVPHRHK